MTLVEVDPIDRGSAVPGERVSRRVRVQNVSERQVTRKVVDKTCGCVDVAFGIERLDPGQTTQVELVVAAAEAEGPQAQQVTLAATAALDSGTTIVQRARIALSYTPAVPFVARPTRASVAVLKGKDALIEFALRPVEGRRLEVLRAEAKPGGVWQLPTVETSSDRMSARVKLRPVSADKGAFGVLRVTGASGSLTLVAEVQRLDALRLGEMSCGEPGVLRCPVHPVAGATLPTSAQLLSAPAGAACTLASSKEGQALQLTIDLTGCRERPRFGRVRFTDGRGVELADLPWLAPPTE